MEIDQAVIAVSVITIVKNNEKLLPRAVDSVLSQTFTDFEHIIVNDGSTDGTKGLIDEYAATDKRIRPKHLLQNIGRAMARNAGLDEAKGRYIFFLDSDDYLPSTALMDLYEVAEKNNADIVYGRIKSFDQIRGNWLPSHYTDLIIQFERHNFILDDHLDLVDNHQIVGRIFRNEFLKKNGLKFSLTRKNGEDVLFAFFSAFHARNISMVPHQTVYFYSLGNYLAAASENKLFDARDNVIETINYALKYGSDRLKKRMRQKGVMFAGSLERAQKIYEGDEEKFITYLATLVPFVEDLSEDELAGLPQYFQEFARAMRLHDFTQVRLLWAQRNKRAAPKKTAQGEKKVNREFERLKLANQKLAHQLDAVYNSTSWRMTAPLRRIKHALTPKRTGSRQTVDYSVSSPGARMLPPGLDMSLELSGGGFGKHRSGWKAVAIDSLMPLHNPEAVYFVSFLEKIFLWGKPKPVLFPRPWIGVTHRPHNIPSWLPDEMRSLFYQSEYFADTLPDCRGIFTLSNYHAKHIREILSVPVETLLLPTEIPEKQWDPESLTQPRTKVVQVGWWLRKLHGIFMLPPGDYEKIYLTKRAHEPVDRYFSIEADYLKRQGVFRDSMYDTARTVDFLTNDDYDELLSTSVIFLDLYDASANNAVVEGIARATPVLVNPIEPVVEYLGEEYPLYYRSYEEAAEKMHDRDLLLAAHKYLQHCPTREKLSGSYFRRSIEQSAIYAQLCKQLPHKSYAYNSTRS